MARFAANLSRLKPNDIVTVYHGTSLYSVRALINGFDANRLDTKRDYQAGGYRHAGLFVTPSERTASSFGQQIILKIKTRAKNLHGTDYSGKIGRKHLREINEETRKWIEEMYPNSFRPYLSMTLQQSVEPQALLRGLVSPRQIVGVRFKPHGKSAKWYTRKAFLALGLMTHDRGESSYGPKNPVTDVGFDLSSTRHTLDEFIDGLSVVIDTEKSRVVEMLSFYVGLGERGRPRIERLLQQAHFGTTAARRFMQLLWENPQSIGTGA